MQKNTHDEVEQLRAELEEANCTKEKMAVLRRKVAYLLKVYRS